MSTRRWMIALLSVALLATCGLTYFTFYRSLSALKAANLSDWSPPWGVGGRWSESTTTQVFPVTLPARLHVNVAAGDVSVKAGAPGRITLKLIKRASADTEALALTRAKALTVTVQSRSDGVDVDYDPGEAGNIFGGKQTRGRVNVEVEVPPEATLELSTSAGDVAAMGTTGSAVLRSNFGNVSAATITGSLTATSQSGDIDVDDVTSTRAAITLRSQFGDVSVQRLVGKDLSIESASGEIVGHSLAFSDHVKAVTRFGDVRLEDLAADQLVADSSSGDVDLLHGAITSTLSVKSRFGDVTVDRVQAGGVLARTDNGSIRIVAPRGPVDAQTKMGDVSVEAATGAVLNMASDRGELSFGGTLEPGAQHRLSTGLGDILIRLPANTDLGVDLETQLGNVSSDLPFVTSGQSGSQSERHWSGRVNDGGGKLGAATRAGDVRIEGLSEAR